MKRFVEEVVVNAYVKRKKH